jgi:Lon protease-like protein
MMEHEYELRDFSGVARLFPLPNLVMFPHVVLPLHIFEPRYRQMTEHSLAGDRLITLVQMTPAPAGKLWTEPVPVEEVGCLGRIIQHERLPDGRFNFLLLGLRRVRLLHEIASDNLYRSAEVEILEDIPASPPEQARREELVSLFRRYYAQFHEPDPDLAELLGRDVPLNVLSDIMVHTLTLTPQLKQCLLAETSVDRRVLKLTTILHKLIGGAADSRPFPPPFSVN